MVLQGALNLDLPRGNQAPSFSGMADNSANQFGASADPLKINDVLNSSTGASFNLSGNLGLSWRIALVVFQLSLGVNGSVATTKSSVSFTDMDGDGLPDHCVKLPGEAFVRVKRNLAGAAGLLKSVGLPQGGSYDFGYERTGNTPDMPQSRWALSRITRSAGALPAGRLLIRDENDLAYTDNPDMRYGGTSRFTYVAAETTRNYDVATGAAMERRVEYEYESPNRYGNVAVFRDLGDTSVDGDELTATFAYDYSKSAYLRQLPSSIEVTDAKGNMLRRREGEYGDHGELLAQRQYYDKKKAAEYQLSWDQVYGNLLSITDPRGARTSYSYDEDLKTFVTTIDQDNPRMGGPRYESGMTWDLATGQMTSKTDPNGRRMSYAYDGFGRLVEVRSPYDTGLVPAVRYEYLAGPGPWTAVTYNKLHFDPSDTATITTALSVDGLGRALQTAKEGEYRDGKGTRHYGWNLSGAIAYDQAGRSVAEGQATFAEGRELPAPGPLTKATRKTYDALDRVRSVVLPDGASSATSYGIVDGKSYERGIDPLGNIGEKRSDARGDITDVLRMDKDGNPLTKASYEYDALSQMLRALDKRGSPVVVGYDLLGRRTSLSSPDSGLVQTEYDESGNPTRKTDSVLRGLGEGITYSYDGLNRLVRIDYPKSPSVEYSYGGPEAAATNAAGRVTLLKDESGTTSYSYGYLGETTGLTRTIDRLDPHEGPVTASFRYLNDYLGRLENIVYPDGEKVSYGYDSGGQIASVVGEHHGIKTTYVADIAYDPFGQRTYIENGNGTKTEYSYDPDRRWLDSIHSTGAYGVALQDMTYRFDKVGNVLGYDNEASGYSTTQSYGYDALYQITGASGKSVYKPYGYEEGSQTYGQTFAYDDIGNLTQKTSASASTGGRKIGADLNYSLDYTYDSQFPHRAERIGDIRYQYDQNGNVTSLSQAPSPSPPAPTNNGNGQTNGNSNGNGKGNGQTNGNAYGFGNGQGYAYGRIRNSGGSGYGTPGNKAWSRTYSWDEENRLTRSVEGDLVVDYRYGADGQRAVKYSQQGESLYFDAMWLVTAHGGDLRQSKNIYVGQTRIATRQNHEPQEDADYELKNTYWYHPDHLGSAQLVTDPQGQEYERIEYTPYGESWVEMTHDGMDLIPYRFTGKELDEETGLYYYGARYLDPRTSQWLSADPALAEYIPSAPVDDQAKERNQNLPGMGGVYNTVNFQLYHYAGNNPVKYTDPDGKFINVLIGAAIGGAIGAIGAGISGGNIWAGAAGGAVSGAMAGATGGLSLAAQIGGTALAGTAGYLADRIVSGQPGTLIGIASSAVGGAAGQAGGILVGKGLCVAVSKFASSTSTFSSVSNLLASISSFDRLKGGVRQGFVVGTGSAQDAFASLTKGAEKLENGMYLTQQGEMIGIHESTRGRGTTIDIVKDGQSYKIGFRDD